MPAIKNALAACALLLVLGCQREPSMPLGKAAPAPPPPDAGVEGCVDLWLQERGLDPYGHPEGTLYAGGTPLFDERTGEQTPRLTYVFGRHRAAQEACAPGQEATDPGPQVR